MSFKIDPYLFDHGFCESKMFNGHPEILNSISSLLMSFMAIREIKEYQRTRLYGLNYMNNDLNHIRLMLSSLMINGLTSAIYHYTGNIGSGILDRTSMILICITSYNYLKVINLYTLLHIFITILSLSLHEEDLFNLMFLIYLIIIYYTTKDYSSGGKLLLFSAVCWSISELFFCNWLTYSFHAIWHYLCAYSMKIIIHDSVNHQLLLIKSYV